MLRANKANLVAVLQDHAYRIPERLAFRFLRMGEDESEAMTFGSLWNTACLIGQVLQRRHAPGSHVLILAGSGLAFIRAFIGCMAAGLVPIPVKAPRKTGMLEPITRLIQDARPCALLCTSTLSEEIVTELSQCCTKQGLSFYGFDEIEAQIQQAGMQEKAIIDLQVDHFDPDSLAFIQYTSGSTGQPRGVTISHRNLMANQAQIQAGFGHHEETVFVSWLPTFHDMGLVGCVLHPIYLGIPCTLMPPEAFIQRPLRWLKAIDRYKATTSGAPNFAYDHCVERLARADLSGLDLSHWRVAFNGSEPVKQRSLTQFSQVFGPCGFSIDRFLPCYGLAEATLFVCGKHHDPAQDIAIIPALQQTQPTDLANPSSPQIAVGLSENLQPLKILDPETRQACADGEIGEIFIGGENISKGYFASDPMLKLPPLQQAGFHATGDLGMIKNGRLFVTGRIKDLIILRGRNIYPHDIEDAIARCPHPSVFQQRSVAFSTLSGFDDGPERIIALIELRRINLSDEERALAQRSIRHSVETAIGIGLDEIVFIPKGAIPMTTSGKPRRSLARQDYMAGRYAPNPVETEEV
jgi:acyl-CoA synthetase (AMP-forming)/AMP-acid ligase II